MWDLLLPLLWGVGPMALMLWLDGMMMMMVGPVTISDGMSHPK
jgi:hypothetical protein